MGTIGERRIEPCGNQNILYMSTFDHLKTVVELTPMMIQTSLPGGMGLGVFETSLIAEEMAFGCAGITAAVTVSSIGVSLAWKLFLQPNLHLDWKVFME